MTTHKEGMNKAILVSSRCPSPHPYDKMEASLRAYLDARGLVMVPKEPTQDMVDAYWTQSGESREMKDRTLIRSLRYYEAFLVAAPDPFGGE